MTGGATRYDLIVPHDEIFRVKREWVDAGSGKAMPVFIRYTAWGAWAVATVLTLVVEFGTGLMSLGWLSALIVLASLIFETLAVMTLFLFGVDYERPMLAVVAQLWRGCRLQISGLRSTTPQPLTLQLRATARQERPARLPWHRRLATALPVFNPRKGS